MLKDKIKEGDLILASSWNFASDVTITGKVIQVGSHHVKIVSTWGDKHAIDIHSCHYNIEVIDMITLKTLERHRLKRLIHNHYKQINDLTEEIRQNNMYLQIYKSNLDLVNDINDDNFIEDKSYEYYH